MLEILKLLQMAQFVGVKLPYDQLLMSSTNKEMADDLWDIVDEFYSAAYLEWISANVGTDVETVAWTGEPEDNEWADDLPF